MKQFGNISIAILVILALSSCKKDNLEDVVPVDLGGETYQKTALDQWLLDSLTLPYNIAVKYRWDPGELNHLDQSLTPPDESKIIPAMQAIKRVWIDPYNAETGSDLFIKKYAPKQFILVGSVEYNPNGTVLLGQAEGGNSIAFFDVNQNFDKNSISSIQRMIQTSHHEFAHILHQNVLFPTEFRGISQQLNMAGYTGTWFNVSQEEARDNGYITNYAMSRAEEDFVETIANMLFEGRDKYEEIVSSVNPTAQQALRSKEQFVVDYFQEVWNIDFYSLQTRVQAALNALVPLQDVDEMFGSDKIYNTASVNPQISNILPQSSAFNTIYNNSAAAVAQVNGLGLQMDSLQLITTAPDETILGIYLSLGNDVYLAQFEYQTALTNGVYSFTFSAENDVAEVIHDAVVPLLDYFQNNQFSTSWYADPLVSIYPRAKFSPVAAPSNYFMGLLFQQ